jgi:hypothetical protein
LQIADRLFTSFGEDLQECLFSKTSLTQLSFATPLSNLLRLSCYFLLTILNTRKSLAHFSEPVPDRNPVVHSVILIYQLTSLNVAINSFDQSLLTLLVSNQFVEIKGSVFKKFEKDSLLQITCAGSTFCHPECSLLIYLQTLSSGFSYRSCSSQLPSVQGWNSA